jgi:DNA-binding winged helix-turn-helix (wHTH) protein/Tol biopolymer transport system component
VLKFVALPWGRTDLSFPSKSRSLARFGAFELDFETAELRNNGTRASLQGQPLQIISVLLEDPGRLVTRDELKKKLWPADTFVDFDQSLNRAMNRLRDALGDSAEHPHFIETLPRRGYRFIAPVTWDDANGLAVTGKLDQGQDGRASHDSATVSDRGLENARSRRSFLLIGVLAVLLMLAATASVIWHRRAGRPEVSLEHLEITKLTDNGTVKNVAISQDGRYVAYAVDQGDRQGLRLRQVAAHGDVEVLAPDAGNFVGLAFSPDGNYIYFVRSDRNDISFRYLYVIPSLGGTPRKLITDVDSGVSFSPDGHKIAYEHWIRNDMELKIANPDGTGQQLVTVVHNANFLSPGDPAPTWSPDGRTIAFSKLLVGKERRYVLFTVSVGDGQSRELYSDEATVGKPIWSPSGDTLLVPHFERNVRRSQLWTVSFPSGTARRFTHDISNYSMDLDLTRNGDTLAAITGVVQSQISVSTSTDLQKLEDVAHGDTGAFHLKVNQDGKILTTDSNGGLRIMDADGTHASALGNVHNVSSFTLCGQSVVLTSNEWNSTALLRLEVDKARLTQLATGNLWSPACSPDNRFVYYVNLEQPEKIWRLPLEGGTPVEIAQVLGDSIMGDITVSPDGQFISYPYSAYTGTSPGRHLAIIPAAGGPPSALFDLPGDSWNVGPYWKADGKAFQYLQVRDGVSNIWEQSLDDRAPRQLTRYTSGQIFDFAWSSDGKRLFLTRGSVSNDVVLLNGLH